jgi:hypothetical protein
MLGWDVASLQFRPAELRAFRPGASTADCRPAHRGVALLRASSELRRPVNRRRRGGPLRIFSLPLRDGHPRAIPLPLGVTPVSSRCDTSADHFPTTALTSWHPAFDSLPSPLALPPPQACGACYRTGPAGGTLGYSSPLCAPSRADAAMYAAPERASTFAVGVSMERGGRNVSADPGSYRRRNSDPSPALDVLRCVGRPPRFRARASLGKNVHERVTDHACAVSTPPRSAPSLLNGNLARSWTTASVPLRAYAVAIGCPHHLGFTSRLAAAPPGRAGRRLSLHTTPPRETGARCRTQRGICSNEMQHAEARVVRRWNAAEAAEAPTARDTPAHVVGSSRIGRPNGCSREVPDSTRYESYVYARRRSQNREVHGVCFGRVVAVGAAPARSRVREKTALRTVAGPLAAPR